MEIPNSPWYPKEPLIPQRPWDFRPYKPIDPILPSDDLKKELEKAIRKATEEREKKKKDAVNHPEHYQSKSGIEVIDVIEAFELDFYLANAIKYILRSDKKGNEVQDLEKAIWYLKRKLEKLNGKDKSKN